MGGVAFGLGVVTGALVGAGALGVAGLQLGSFEPGPQGGKYPSGLAVVGFSCAGLAGVGFAGAGAGFAGTGFGGDVKGTSGLG